MSEPAEERVKPLTITPTGATLGALVTNVRLDNLDDETWYAIEAAFHKYAVLVFPSQFLDGAAQQGFAKRFGDLIIDAVRFSSEKDDGTLRGESDAVMKLYRGNEDWHTDSSFQEISAKVSILSSVKVPKSGGQTQWADMRAAFDMLEPNTRLKISRLNARHSLYHSQKKVGGAQSTTTAGLRELHGKTDTGAYQPPDENRVPLRPLVKVHPVTGRPSLFIGRHAHGIEGISNAESERLLEELTQFSCQSPRIYSHDWKVGDIVIWDNRCVLHRVRSWPLDSPRVMLHTRVGGNPYTEGAISMRTID